MRVFALLLDGLELDLVERWNLEGLKQVEYGRYEAPISPTYGKPHTPSAWYSFITGKPPAEHGVDSWWTYGSFLDWIRMKPPLVWIKNKRKLFWRLGLKPRVVDKRDTGGTTIFDLVKPSIAVNVPTYNEPTEYHYELSKALEKGVREYEKKIWEIHKRRVSQVFEKIGDEWKLFMAWFDIADLMGHLHLIKRPQKLRRVYQILDDLAQRLKGKVPDETLFLIVSDHGMTPSGDGVTGDHSLYGFYSINKNLEFFKPKKITDFFPYILRITGTDTI